MHLHSSEKMDFNAMAPLHIMHYNNPDSEEKEDWDLFSTHLEDCKKIGIDAISVDVWWGLVETSNNQFYWSYYFKVFEKIVSAGLDIIPIISFHSFDPGPSFKFNAKLPNWVWDHLNLISDYNPIDLKYNSEDININQNPKFSDEYIALWANEWVFPQYSEFINEFVQTFDKYLVNFQEINISLGPSGELRYPSYNSHDGGQFPNRGRMQCFSNLAKTDYLKWLDDNKRQFLSSNESFLQSDTLKFLLDSSNYLEDQRIINLIEWYNYSLMDHGNKMLKIALNIIPKNIPIGFKIPGIHWRIDDPKMPRIAEMTCGLINAKTLDGESAYFNSLSIVLKDLPVNRLILHFTCVEQENPEIKDEILLGYSRPEDLVNEVGFAAKKLGLKLKGENSLSKNLYKESSWVKIKEILSTNLLSGITIMRMQDISSSNKIGQDNYRQIIRSNVD